MSPRLIRPLFCDSAAGSISTLGVIRSRGSRFFLSREPQSNGIPPPAGAQIRAMFAAAHTEWMRITPTPQPTRPNKPDRRSPSWPDYWRQWLIDHPYVGISAAASMATAAIALMAWGPDVGIRGSATIGPLDLLIVATGSSSNDVGPRALDFHGNGEAYQMPSPTLDFSGSGSVVGIYAAAALTPDGAGLSAAGQRPTTAGSAALGLSDTGLFAWGQDVALTGTAALALDEQLLQTVASTIVVHAGMFKAIARSNTGSSINTLTGEVKVGYVQDTHQDTYVQLYAGGMNWLPGTNYPNGTVGVSGTIADLTPGDVIGPDSLYTGGEEGGYLSATAKAGGTFYQGLRSVVEADRLPPGQETTVCYSWIKYHTTAGDGYPCYIIATAMDTSGAPLTITGE